MVKALDSYLTKEENQEIEKVFSQLNTPKFKEMLLQKKKKVMI